jgi:hypothetical protein
VVDSDARGVKIWVREGTTLACAAAASVKMEKTAEETMSAMALRDE